MAVGLIDELAVEYATLPDLPPTPEVLPEIPASLLEAPSETEPPRCEHGCGERCGAQPDTWVLPEVPAELIALDELRPGPVLVGPAGPEQVAAFRASEPVQAEVFAHHHALVQAHTARMWTAAGAMIAAAGVHRAEFVGDHLALLMGVHPRTGRNVAFTAMSVCAVPELLTLVETGVLSERHASALLEQAGRFAAGDADLQAELIGLTLERCQARVGAGHCWPTPGELKKRLATVAVLRDLTAAEKASRSAADRRTVSACPTGVGAAALSIEGPQACIAQVHDALRARAEALGRLPGDTRTLDQRMHDAALELLSVDAEGGPSVVPAVGHDGGAVTLTVRGVQVALIMPVSVAVGGDLELAEIPGLGPVLPSTARELTAQADAVQRTTVDSATGQVLSVDPPVPGPRRLLDRDATQHRHDETSSADDAPQSDADAVERDPAHGPDAPEAVRVLLGQLTRAPVELRDLSSDAYRPPDRLRRYVERRDRTCTFPGCTVPGERCDIDHREPWPHGPTSEQNNHCLCRRHHRAKQAYFTVELDEHDNTVWTTPDGGTYRRPPPTY